MRKNVDDFIKDHSHINYCEALLYKDGTLEYATPSHCEALIRATGESRDVIYDKMPTTASPIHWLVEYTGIVAIYTKAYMCPKSITEEQQKSLDKLIEVGLTKKANY